MRLTALRWGWECNARWQGIGKSFTLDLPAPLSAAGSTLIIEGMRYNDTFKQIEAWGYMKPNNNISTQYKDDIINPECAFGPSRRKSDGGTDGKT